MFEFLEHVPTENFLAAIYFAVRLMSHRHDIGDYRKALPVEGVNTEPSAMDAQLAKKVVAEILEREGTTLGELAPRQVSKYISQLSRLAEERVAGDLPNAHSTGRGGKLLEKWRAAAESRWPSTRSA